MPAVKAARSAVSRRSSRGGVPRHREEERDRGERIDDEEDRRERDEREAEELRDHGPSGSPFPRDRPRRVKWPVRAPAGYARDVAGATRTWRAARAKGEARIVQTLAERLEDDPARHLRLPDATIDEDDRDLDHPEAAAQRAVGELDLEGVPGGRDRRRGRWPRAPRAGST